MRDWLRHIRSHLGYKMCALGAYAIVADIMLCVVVLPFQRYALVMARSDGSTPVSVLGLLLCDLLMLVYVVSGMAANGAFFRCLLLKIPTGKGTRW